MQRRHFLQAGAVAGSTLVPGLALAQGKAPEFKFKLGTDLPVTHSVNVRLKEAIATIQSETNGRVAIELFPNNQLGSDSDMMSQIRSGALDLVVIDSVAALVPRAEIEGEMGDSHVGLQARLMSQALRKITGALHQSKTTAIFINQLREKIGVFFGSPETTTGGNALKFYASVRLDIRRIGAIKDRDETIGNQTRVKVVKNKVAPPFRAAEFDIVFGEGISKSGEIIDMGVELGIIAKSGSWFSYNSDKLGQGREGVKQLLRDNPELSNEIETKIREKIKEMQAS